MVPFPFARFDGAARRDQVRLRFVHCGHQGIDVFELNAAERNGRPRRYLSRYVYACPCSGLRPAAPAPGCSPCHGWPAPVVACVAGARWVRRAGAGRRAGDKCARVVTRRVLQSRCAHARLRRGGVARAYAVRYIYAVITSLLVGHQGAEAKGKKRRVVHTSLRNLATCRILHETQRTERNLQLETYTAIWDTYPRLHIADLHRITDYTERGRPRR